MAQPIPITQRQLTFQGRIPEVEFSPAGVALKQKQAQILANTATAMDERIANNSYLRAQGVMSKEISRIEGENSADPENMQKALGNWSSKFMEDIYDPEIKARLEVQFQESSLGAISRATTKRNALITEQGQYETYMSMDNLQTEMQQVAVDAFASDPVQRATAGRRLQELMLRGQKVLSQAGPDGTPYLSPQQRSAYMLSLRDGSLEAMSRAWFMAQPNKLHAASQWMNNEVTIDMPDGEGNFQKVNMRDTMPASAQVKADGAIMGLLNDQIAIENHAMAMEEKVNQDNADAALLQVQQTMQGDPNVVGPQDPMRYAKALDFLDMNQNAFLKGGRVKEYLALRQVAVSGEPLVEDGGSKNFLLSQAQQGIDPTDVGLNMVTNRQITQDTYDKAKAEYERKQGPYANVLNSALTSFEVSAGATNQVLLQNVPGASEAIEDGKDYIRKQYKGFVQVNQREPTVDEMNKIKKEALDIYSAVAPSQRIFANIPDFIPRSDVLAEKTPQTYARLQQAVVNHFTVQYGVDPAHWPDDEEIIQSKKFLEQYQLELGQKQQQSANKVQ